ncbi:MAG: YbhB/YbcL family Raf kinase inhibitor-like protein [Acidobacteriota bacterium]
MRKRRAKAGAVKARAGFTLPPVIKITVAGRDGYGSVPGGERWRGWISAISWTQVPAGTVSFTLLFHDPDPVLQKNASTDVTHWLVWNIPGTVTSLAANFPKGDQADGTKQTNITNQPQYMGPAPPAGHGPHHYTFELWALDAKIDVPAGADRQAVLKLMDGHVLGKGYFATTFENK